MRLFSWLAIKDILEGGGGSSKLQSKEVTITENGETTISPDTGYDGLSEVDLTVNVPTGGGGEEINDVNFFDYDGTVLHSYTAQEFLALTEMPANPTHEGLTSQGWNWTLADAKAQVQDIGACNIGQMYTTDDGKTRIHIELKEGRLSPYLQFSLAGTASVNWGDGSTPDTITNSASQPEPVSAGHTYANAGQYVIEITVVSGQMGFSATNTQSILFKPLATNYRESMVYSSCVKSVNIGNNVVSIGEYAFIYCHSLSSITIPDSVTSIGNSAFNYCNALSSITIPDSVTSIGNYTFNYCYSLSSITIPDSVISIGNSAFANATSLSSITIPDSVTSIGERAFNYCHSLSSITIPDSVINFANFVFQNCNALSSITIPDSVTSFGNYTIFSCNALSSITIPSGVTSIGNGAFSENYGMAECHLLPTTPPSLGTDVFKKNPSDMKIYVPSASVDAYKSASGWSSYASIIYGE